ncbi:pleckstrin homology domain-containing family A member 7 isoform X3 [Protopterus annectens]|uniref:pleckstrin homology domain-containing family A member 7 isoform X3 n=1 Tax=Protopterus annectens TaxID=7888 RepID=UPI001CF9F17F|nr:pleckstrin homology domain-containing family A member 7 isoform X3 [Protopterus annectens]
MWNRAGISNGAPLQMNGYPFYQLPAPYSHNQRTTTFRHPVTGEISPENKDFILKEQPKLYMSKQQVNQRPSSMVSEPSTAVTTSTVDTTSGSKASRSSGKVHSFGKRDHSIKRNPNVPVVVRGWLHKQDSSGMRLWKRRWFVLADYCLFYYKDSREEAVLGSIPLPSYVVSPVIPEDRINRKYSFKAVHSGMRNYIHNKNSVIGPQAEHSGMRTYYFSADTQEDMNGWIRAMNQAAVLQTCTLKREFEMEKQPGPQSNHIDTSKSTVVIESSEDKENPMNFEGDSLHLSRHERIRKKEATLRYDVQKSALDEQGRKQEHHKHLGTTPVNDTCTETLSSSQSWTAQPQHVQRNGTIPNAITSLSPVAQNGTSTHKRGFVPRSETDKEAQRKSNLVQVEDWVKVHKGDNKSLASEQTLTRRTSSQSQPQSDKYQSLPKNTRQPSGNSPPPPSRDLPSDYRYAQDRISHIRMSNEERKATKEGTVWQLYEWQQRQQFKHGSPTAPPYVTSPDYADTSGVKTSLEVPRSISVPPSPSDIPPPGPPKTLSPRRPHTPAERLTVRPLNERVIVDIPLTGSPGRIHHMTSKNASHADRRSMPSMGYMTHTVSAPSLHGKSPEELTLLLIRLRRHQALLTSLRNYTLNQLQQYEPYKSTFQVDDTYLQLKKDLEYLDLKVSGSDAASERKTKPVKVAESDVDVTLSRLCEHDRVLQDLEDKIRALKENKDKLESVLEVCHRQMEQYREQPQHTEKITCQQRLLQEDLVQIRAQMSKVSTEMENAWNEYVRLEMNVNQLRNTLQSQMKQAIFPQEKAQLQRDFWRIEDVMAGLSANKINYKIIIESIKNPERKTVPSLLSSTVPSSFSIWDRKPAALQSPPLSPTLPSVEFRLQPPSQPYAQPQQQKHTQPSVQQHLRLHTNIVQDEAPPRPPLPDMYGMDDAPPLVPPLPREASIIRHTSVRGLKRQSDERKRDREHGQYVNGDYKMELRSYMSEPELESIGRGFNKSLVGISGFDSGYQTLPSRGLSGSTSKLYQPSVLSSYATLQRGATTDSSKERPKSALERLYSGEHQRGRMSAEEQLARMKRHQKALVRERKRTLSQGDRQSTASAKASSRPVSADISSWKREQEFDLQLLERAVHYEEKERAQQDGWFKVQAVPVVETDIEPEDYNLDISKELSKPEKVLIPERYVELEPDEPPTCEELEERHRKVERIKSILTRSSMHNIPVCIPQEKHNSVDLDSQLEEQERIITISYALASEASQKSKQVAVQQQVYPVNSPSAPQSSHSPVSNGFHYTFV